MAFTSVLDGMESRVNADNRAVAAATQRAAETGETTDFLLAQRKVADYTNVVGFYSSTIKFLHDMIAGIIQKM